MKLWKLEDPLSTEDVRAKLRNFGWAPRYLEATWDRSRVPRFEPRQGVYICGPVGTGKTSVAALIAIDFVTHFNCVVSFTTAGRLFDLFFDRKTELAERLMDTYLLFIDDIGIEYPADFALAKFETFIEHRYGHNYPTFFTSNLIVDDLKKRRGYERIADRINDPGWTQHIIIPGESQRTRTPFNDKERRRTVDAGRVESPHRR